MKKFQKIKAKYLKEGDTIVEHILTTESDHKITVAEKSEVRNVMELVCISKTGFGKGVERYFAFPLNEIVIIKTTLHTILKEL